jgi:hypothetical protein
LSKVEVVDGGCSEHDQRTDEENSQCPPEGRISQKSEAVGELRMKRSNLCLPGESGTCASPSVTSRILFLDTMVTAGT